MWTEFTTFGTWSAGALGLFFLIKFFKACVDTLVHLFALHSVFGWSIYLLAAVWDSLINLLLHLKRDVKVEEETKNQGPTPLPRGDISISIPNATKDQNEHTQTNLSSTLADEMTPKTSTGTSMERPYGINTV